MDHKSLLKDIPIEVLESLLLNNSSLRGYLQGYAAEEFLMRRLNEDESFCEISKIPDQSPQKGDIQCLYRATPLTIEVKSLKTGSDRDDFLVGGFVANVAVKKTDKPTNGTSHITQGEFDILAICTYNVTGEWDFYFMAGNRLPTIGIDSDKVKTSFKVNVTSTPFVHADIHKAIADLS